MYMKEKAQLLPHVKTNSRCIIDLKYKANAIKFLQANIGEYLYNIGVDKDFLGQKSSNQ